MIERQASRKNAKTCVFHCEESVYKQKGQSLPMFHMCREGFTHLTMAYSGTKALRVKLAFFAAFKAMERQLDMQDSGQKALPSAAGSGEQAQVFSFESHHVRTLVENGQTWFVGRDIASLLGYAKPDKEIQRSCKHTKLFKGTNLVHLNHFKGLGNTPRGLLIIPESDVWRLIIRSTLPKAQEIENWIMSEVLPAIRKTGKYEAAAGETSDAGAEPAPKPTDGKAEAKPKPKSLPRPKQKALPPAPGPSWQEKCAEAVAGMFDLHSQVFLASMKMRDVFQQPFWSRAPEQIPEDRESFAKAMNLAISSFMMTATANVEVAGHLFTAYVEGEKLMRK
jgi:prophage antirepressor-like protein